VACRIGVCGSSFVAEDWTSPVSAIVLPCATSMTDRKTHPVQVRLSEEDRAALQRLADERFGGNVSDAVRQALVDMRVLDMARREYWILVRDHGLKLPQSEERGNNGLDVMLSPWPELGDNKS
jgi:Arc/MetJ-type ribon-helix-helix transcriptional regulator